MIYDARCSTVALMIFLSLVDNLKWACQHKAYDYILNKICGNFYTGIQRIYKQPDSALNTVEIGTFEIIVIQYNINIS